MNYRIVEEIKQRIDIVEFLGGYIALKKAGRNFKAICPFHQEKSPSFVISPDRQIWHCFGACHEGGDIIKFLMKWENITFREAVQELAVKAGVKIEEEGIQDEVWSKKETLLKLNRLATEYFKYLLYDSPVGQKAREYLKKRHISIPIAKKFEIGYAAQSWDLLLRFGKKKKYSEDVLLEAGLVIKSEKGRYYDRFRERLMFPLKDARGNVIGFSGRSLSASEREAKYINSPETTLYHKRECFFGLDLAKDAIKKERNAFLVEGEFDVISPYQHGYENFVAIKGSAITREQLLLLRHYTNRVTLALDGDAAGEDAIKRSIQAAESSDFEMDVVVWEGAKDPDELLQKDPTLFKKLVKNSIPIYDFLMQSAQKRFDLSNPYGKKEYAQEIIAYLLRIQNPIVRAHYIKVMSHQLKLSEEAVGEMFTRSEREERKKRFHVAPRQEVSTVSREETMERYLLSALFQLESAATSKGEIFRILEPEDFLLPSHQKIVKFLVQDSTQPFIFTEFAKIVPPELQEELNTVYLFASLNDEQGERNILRLGYEIKREALKRKLHALMEEESGSSDSVKLKDIQLLLSQVEKKLNTL